MTAEETNKKQTEGEPEIRNRSYSPLSQDFKSQDSGFSDSERSDCSEAYENATPRRKLRRKRMRRRIQPASPWLEEESPPKPTHTSTPKNSRLFVARNRLKKSASTSLRGQRWANYSLTLIKEEKLIFMWKRTAEANRSVSFLLHFKHRLGHCWLRIVRTIGSDSTHLFVISRKADYRYSDINNFNVNFRDRVATGGRGNRHDKTDKWANR